MRPLVDPVPELDPDERKRTARHTVLKGIGDEGQRRLAATRVAVVGAGGIGSPAILALAAAGIGGITVIDDDIVELHNLQRQIAHRIEDIGVHKTESAVRAVAALSPVTVVTPVTARLDETNAQEFFAGADIVIDTSDSFATRRAVAAATEALGIPLVWGAVREWYAQVTVFWSNPTDAAPVVLNDLFAVGTEGDPPTCAQVGVLGALCVQVGGLLSTEVVKLAIGVGEPLLGRLLVLDSLSGRQREIPLRSAETAAASA
ncbi:MULTISPECIES: HesA/MoeB/ThiF family protein [unclassified Microbacterium]|uniref:HesA/MoeB/ThiF family protein n=1 Tax=unclassified Microbacterium TaxID=2609290 RepID=UPI0038655F0C